jgi:glycosyltransferase involved in cell wall biosynthesis
MRIAYVSADRGVPVFGMKGCSLHVQEVVRAFRGRELDVSLFAAAVRGEPPADLHGIHLHKLKHTAVSDVSERERTGCDANRDTLTRLHASGPFDLVYERYSLWSHAGMNYAREVGIPGVLEVNAPLIEEQEKYRGLIDRSAAERIARSCFEYANTLIAVSEGVADYLEQFTEARGKIHVVPNGVNPARFQTTRSVRSAPPGIFTVGFVGTLKPWHGLEGLFESFTRLLVQHPQVRLLIVGDGPEAGKLHKRIASAGLDKIIEMTGAIRPEDIPQQLARMDVGVAPYPDDPDFYFSPLKVYEYMAAGLPVVASRIGQLDGLVVHEQNGLLYKPGDSNGLSTALARLTENRAWARDLGKAARQSILAAHTWDDRIEQILQLAAAGVQPHVARGTG